MQVVIRIAIVHCHFEKGASRLPSDNQLEFMLLSIIKKIYDSESQMFRAVGVLLRLGFLVVSRLVIKFPTLCVSRFDR
jgi:hypothetical protein